MAIPILRVDGSVSGPGTPGESRDTLALTDIISIVDTNPANSGASFVWTVEDEPIGSTAVFSGLLTDTISFGPAGLVEGSYRLRLTVDLVDIAVVIAAIKLSTVDARIPSFQESLEFDQAGNAKGWHQARDEFMRNVDTLLAGGAAGNTLDDAYDQGGAGAGRTIIADSGAVQIQGSGGLELTPVLHYTAEFAAVPGGVPATAHGKLWVRNDAPNVLVFTDDTGADTVLGLGSAGNTLDDAYDQGGAGAGRTIIADSGAVQIQGSGGLELEPLIHFISEQGSVPGGVPGAGEAKLWVRNDAPNALIYTDDTGADLNLTGAATHNTLDAAYDQGGAGAGRTITADSGAVVMTSTAADNNNILELIKNPAGPQSGNALDILMGVNTTGLAINAVGDTVLTGKMAVGSLASIQPDAIAVVFAEHAVDAIEADDLFMHEVVGGAAATTASHARTLSGYYAAVGSTSANDEDWTATVGVRAFDADVTLQGTTTAITGAAAFYARNASVTGGVALDNWYGLYVEDMTAGDTLNDAIHTVGGRVFLGSVASAGGLPDAVLDLDLADHAAITASTEWRAIDFDWRANTITWATGNFAEQSLFFIDPPSIEAAAASTIDIAAVLRIDNAMPLGTFMSATENYSLYLGAEQKIAYQTGAGATTKKGLWIAHNGLVLNNFANSPLLTLSGTTNDTGDAGGDTQTHGFAWGVTPDNTATPTDSTLNLYNQRAPALSDTGWGTPIMSITEDGDLLVTSSVVMDETATVPLTPAAGKGSWWVRDDAPSVPIFTDDTGVDHNLLVPAIVPSTVGEVTRFFLAGGAVGATQGNFRTRNVGSNAQGFFAFDFPDDFSSLIELVLVGIPAGSFVAEDIDLFSDYGSVGELSTTHQQSNTTSTYSGTASTILEINIAGLYTSAVAGDYAGLQVDHNSIGTTVGYVGIRMRYNKA